MLESLDHSRHAVPRLTDKEVRVVDRKFNGSSLRYPPERRYILRPAPKVNVVAEDQKIESEFLQGCPVDLGKSYFEHNLLVIAVGMNLDVTYLDRSVFSPQDQ